MTRSFTQRNIVSFTYNIYYESMACLFLLDGIHNQKTMSTVIIVQHSMYICYYSSCVSRVWVHENACEKGTWWNTDNIILQIIQRKSIYVMCCVHLCIVLYYSTKQLYLNIKYGQGCFYWVTVKFRLSVKSTFVYKHNKLPSWRN